MKILKGKKMCGFVTRYTRKNSNNIKYTYDNKYTV